MAWVLMDDKYAAHRKVVTLSDKAFRLHTSAIFWCRNNGTDGFIADDELVHVCPQVKCPARYAVECRDRQLWHRADHSCPHPDCPPPRERPGWVLHDYLEYQPTKQEEEAAERKRQEGRSTGGKLGNHRRWHAGATGRPNPDCPYCESVTDRPDRSVTDQYPIGPTDRYAIAPSLSQSSTADVVSQSSDRNARSDPAPLAAVADLADRYGRRLDDDDLLKAVIRTINSKTGRTICADDARRIAAGILGSARRRVSDAPAYVTRAIEREPDPAARWLRPPAILVVLPGGGTGEASPHAFEQSDGDPLSCRVCQVPAGNTTRHPPGIAPEPGAAPEPVVLPAGGGRL
jgi:hypothetical protein